MNREKKKEKIKGSNQKGEMKRKKSQEKARKN